MASYPLHRSVWRDCYEPILEPCLYFSGVTLDAAKARSLGSHINEDLGIRAHHAYQLCPTSRR